MGDEAAEEFLISVLVDPVRLKEQTNYVKTLWLLNKEPELELVVTFLEHMQMTAKVKKAEEIDLARKREERDYMENKRYSEQEALMQRSQQQQAYKYIGNNTGIYSSGVTTTGTATKPTSAISDRVTKYWDKVKLDPPF